MKRKIFSGIMLVLLSISILTLTFNIRVSTQASSASGWLNDWSYRKAHVINSASGAGINYQIKIRAHYGNGTDSGEDVYLNTHSRTDFGDVRFTDDGTTELDYWMEEKVDGNSAVFWVEVVDDLSSQDQTIYIYYGNNDATTISNGENTFELFDNFKTFNATKWTTPIDDAYRGWTIENGSLVFFTGTRGKTKGWNVGQQAISQNSFPLDNRVFETRVKMKEGGTIYDPNNYRNKKAMLGLSVRIGRVDRRGYGRHEGLNHWLKVNSYGTEAQIFWSETPWDGSQTNYNILGLWKNGNQIKAYEDYILQTTYSDSLTTGYSLVELRTDVGWYSNDGWGETSYDWARIRKLVLPEPTHGSWGVEEQESYVKVYVDQPVGYIPGVPVGDTVTVDIIIEVNNVTDNSPEGIVGWGLNLTVDPNVLNITRVTGAASGYFLWNFSDWWWEPYPILLSSINSTKGEAIVSEQIMPTPSGGAGDPWSGLKLVTLEFTSKSETAHLLIDLVNVEYMTPDGMWHLVNEVVDGYYNPPPAPDLNIEGIVLPYIAVYHPLIYPNPPLEFGYEINITVTNQGTADAGSFNISLSVLLNDTEIPEYYRKKTISGLNQSVSETVCFDFKPENYGNYTLVIEADCDNDVFELDETDNVKIAWVIGTIQGDIDGDGDVDWFDFGYFATAYGRTFEQPPYHPADFNYDGAVDWYDFGIFAQNYGQNV